MLVDRKRIWLVAFLAFSHVDAAAQSRTVWLETNVSVAMAPTLHRHESDIESELSSLQIQFASLSFDRQAGDYVLRGFNFGGPHQRLQLTAELRTPQRPSTPITVNCPSDNDRQAATSLIDLVLDRSLLSGDEELFPWLAVKECRFDKSDPRFVEVKVDGSVSHRLEQSLLYRAYIDRPGFTNRIPQDLYFKHADHVNQTLLLEAVSNIEPDGLMRQIQLFCGSSAYLAVTLDVDSGCGHGRYVRDAN